LRNELTGGGVIARARTVSRVHVLPTGTVAALVDVDVNVASVGLTVVTGQSGCGKTTLCNLLAGVDQPDGGTVTVDGLDLARLRSRERRRLRRDRLGIALARPSDNVVERLDVARNVQLGARFRNVRVDIESVLNAVGLAGRGEARVADLSGGEQQRLAVALAFLGTPRLVVLDEPTAELDRATSARIVELMRTRASHCAIVVASHDPAVVERADALVVLDRGRRVA
jgi:putative ABC transport system ATP-binding protein